LQSLVLFPWRNVLGNMLPADVQHLDKVQLRRQAMELATTPPLPPG
jgi:hypothetical protein